MFSWRINVPQCAQHVFPPWRKKLWGWPLTTQMSCCVVCRCVAPKSLHIDEGMNVPSQYWRVTFKWIIYFQQLLCEAGGKLSFLTLNAFAIFTRVNEACVLMLLNECMSWAKRWSATPLYHGRSIAPRSGVMLFFHQRKTFWQSDVNVGGWKGPLPLLYTLYYCS